MKITPPVSEPEDKPTVLLKPENSTTKKAKSM